MKELLIFLLLLLFIENIIANTCIGGRLVGAAYQCPKGFICHHGKCQKPIKCINGKLQENGCTCPKRTKLIGGICVKV